MLNHKAHRNYKNNGSDREAMSKEKQNKAERYGNTSIKSLKVQKE